MNKEKLRERCYEMGNSQLPLDVFFNDITQNTNPRFNKLLAYCDLEKIVNYIEDLQKENIKLKKVIEILDDKLDIKLEVYHNGGCTLNYKVIRNCIIPNERCLRYLEVEEYKLLKEVLLNER